MLSIKQHPEYSDYWVTSNGLIYSEKNGKRGKSDTLKEKKLTKDRYGYNIIQLWNNNKGYMHKVHRLVAQTYIPNPHNYHEVNHIDKDKTNNNIDNLEWCNRQQNNEHSLSKYYTIQHIESGDIFEVFNLAKWCRNKGLDERNLGGTFYNKARHSAHGYRILDIKKER